MNTIYKVVRNAKTGLLAVVSELQSSARKSGRTVRRSGVSHVRLPKPNALALLLAGALASSGSHSEPWEQSDTWNQYPNGTWDRIHLYDYRNPPERFSHINTDFFLGGRDAARFYESLDVTTTGNTNGRNWLWTFYLQDYNGREDHFAKKNQAANDTGMILAHASQGLVQQIIRADNFSIESWGNRITKDSFRLGTNRYGNDAGSTTERYYQGIFEEDGTVSAVAEYGIGPDAVRFFGRYALQGATIDRFTNANSTAVTVNGLEFGRGGVAAKTEGDDQGFYMLAVLRALNLQRGATFTFSDETGTGSGNFTGYLTGDGNLALVGDPSGDSTLSFVTYNDLYAVHDQNGNGLWLAQANNYTGSTTISNYTVNATRASVFGSASTADLWATDSRVNVRAAGVFERLQYLASDNAVFNWDFGNSASNHALAIEQTTLLEGETHFAGRGAVTLTTDTFHVEEEGSLLMNGVEGAGNLASLTVNADTAIFETATPFGTGPATAATPRLNVRDALILSGVGSTAPADFSVSANASDADRFVFRVENSNVRLGSNTIAAAETQLFDSSVATSAAAVGRQLGDVVRFDDTSTLAVAGNGAWTLSGLDLRATEDGVDTSDASLVLSAGGIGNAVTFSDVTTAGSSSTDTADAFRGDIRFENAAYTLTTTDANTLFQTAGLGLGRNSRVAWSETDPVRLARLRWDGGELDLSAYDFSDRNRAALTVGELDLRAYSGTAGTIRVDADVFTNGSRATDPESGRFDLTFDNGDFIQMLVAADRFESTILPELVADNYDGAGHTAEYTAENSTETVARGYWNFGLMAVDESNPGGQGIALGYRLNEIELLPGHSAPLVLDGTDPQHDRTLSARVTGNGRLEVRGNVLLAPSSANTFTGSVVVTDGSTLATGPVSGALGSGTTDLTLGRNALFSIAEGTRAQSYVESIGRLAFSDAAGGEVNLNGNTLALSRDESVFTENAELEGTETAVLRFDRTGSALFTNVDLLNAFEGTIAWSANASATTTIRDDDALTAGHFVSRNATGGRDLVFDVDAELSDDLRFESVDLALTDGHAIRAESYDARQSLAGSRLTLESGSRYEQGAWGNMELGGLTTQSGSTLAFENPLLVEGASISASGSVAIGSGTTIEIDQGTTAVDGSFVLLHDETTRNTLISADRLTANVSGVDLRGEENFNFTLRENGSDVGRAYIDGIRLDASTTDLALVYRITELDLTGNLTLDGATADDDTLSAQLTGSGGVTVSRGQVTLENGTNGTSRVGHVNVNALGTLALGDGTSHETLRLTGASDWEGAVTGNWTVALESGATLSLGERANLTGYTGTIDLASGSLLDVGTLTMNSLDNASLRLADDSTVRLSKNYSLLSSFYAGTNADGSTGGGTLEVLAPYAYLGREAQRGGLAHLNLGSEVVEFTSYGALDRDASTGAGVDVDVSGGGTLSLLSLPGAIAMTSEHTNLTNFDGTLALKGSYGSSFVFATDTAENNNASRTLVTVASGSTLGLTGDGVATLEGINLAAGSTLDFGTGLGHFNVTGSAASAVNGTIRVAESRVERKTAGSPLLDLDEGVFDLLVHSETSAPSLTGSNFVVGTGGTVRTTLAEGVTGTFTAGLTTQNAGRDVGGTYRLTQVRMTEGSSLSLDRGGAVDPDSDLETVIQGAGTLRKTDDATVTLRTLEGSDFAGTLDVRGGMLTLETQSAYALTGSHAVVADGAALAVSGEQEMRLDAAGTVHLADGARWDLIGLENTLTGNARLTGEGRLTLEGGRTLRVDTADGALFSDFSGTLELAAGARATFANGGGNTIDFTETLVGSRGSNVALERGAFAFGADTAYLGGYALSADAKLGIRGFDSSAEGFFEVQNRITGTGTVTVDGRASLAYGDFLEGNASDVFTGTWIVNDKAELRLGLRDGADMNASAYEIGLGATLELDFDAGRGFQRIASVNAGKARTGTLRLSGPQHVDVAEGALISLDTIEVTNGAVYHATVPAQTAVTNVIGAGSTMILDGRGEADNVFVISDVLAGRNDPRTVFSGEGRIEILMQSEDTVFTFNGIEEGTEDELNARNEANAEALFGTSDSGFTGTLHIAGGTYLYRDHDSHYFDRIGDFSLGQGATVKVSGGDTLTLPTLSFRPAVNVAGDLETEAPVFDLTDYRGNTVDEDGTVHYTPAARVGHLTVESGGVIMVDPEAWIHNGWGTPEQGGNVLDKDTSSVITNPASQVQLVEADTVEGSGTLELVDTEGNPVGGTSSVVTEYFQEGRVVAQGYWGYNATIRTDAFSANGTSYKPGVFVGYGIRELHLLNAEDSSAPFLFDALHSTDTKFDARITGEGKIRMLGDVTLTNTTNAFTGTVFVDRRSTLSLAGGSWVLGGYDNAMNAPVLVELADLARLDLEAENNYERMALRAGTGSRVQLGDATLLALAEGDFTASSVVSGGSTSTLVIDGNVVMHDAVHQLSEFEGELALEDEAGTVLTMRGTQETVGDDFALSVRDIGTEQSGHSNAIVRLERSARIDDAHGYTGTFEVAAGSDLTIYGSGEMRSQINPNSSIRLSARSRASGDVTDPNSAVGSTLHLVDAAVALNLLETNMGSAITLGTAAIGAASASSGLTLDTLRVNGPTELILTINPERVEKTSLLTFDNPGGAVTNLITAKHASGVDEYLTVSFGSGSEDWRTPSQRTADLTDGDTVIGTVDYQAALSTASGDGNALSIGVTSRVEEIDLWGALNFDMLLGTVGEDAELSAKINEVEGREGEGSVTVTGAGTLRLSNDNRYGSLRVGRDSTLEITGKQTLTGTGGVIEGFLTDTTGSGAPGTGENAGPLLALENAELTFLHVPTGLANGIAMDGGSVLTIEGDGIVPRSALGRWGAAAEFDAEDPEDYVLRGLKLTTGSNPSANGMPELHLSNASGLLGDVTRDAGAEKLRLTLTNSDVRVTADTYAEFGDVRIGTGRTGASLTVADEADRMVTAAGSGATVALGDNSELHLLFENVDSDVRFDALGRVTGTGRVHFDFENATGTNTRAPYDLTVNFADVGNSDALFTGDVLVSNARFEVGSEATDRGMNTLLASTVRSFEAGENTVLAVKGDVALNHLVLGQDALLDLSYGAGNAPSGSPDRIGRLANTLSAESVLFHAGSAVRVDSTTLTAIAGLPGLKTGTSSIEASSVDGKFDLVETLEKAETDATNRFVLVVESEKQVGIVSGVYGAEQADVFDESGNLVTTGDYAINVFDKDGSEAARFEGALKLVADNEGAWLGQDVARAYLKKDTVLQSDAGTYDVKVALFGDETVNLFATDGTVRLTNGLGSVAGSVVADGGELVLAASGVLGNLDDDRAVPTLLSARSGSITLGGAESGAAVEQTVRALEVAAEGELRISDGSLLTIAGSASNGVESIVSGRIESDDESAIELQTARVRLDANADTLALQNTLWSLDDASTLVVDYGVNYGDDFGVDSGVDAEVDSGADLPEATRTITTAEMAVSGGTLVKTGTGRVDFESGVFEAGTTALSVEAGEATVTDWDRSQSVNASGDEKAQALRLAGLSISEGATFTMNGSLLELADRIDPGFAKTGTLRNAGTLKLAPKRTSDTATNFAIRHVYGNYVGLGGTIDIRAALGTGNGDKKGEATVGVTSDALVVHGRATGSVLFSIDLQHEDLNRGALERMVLLRATDGGDLTYALVDGPIESGGYTYFAADREAPEGGRDYILTSYGEDGVRTVSPDRGAYLGVAASTGMFGLSIHDRLGVRPYVDPFTGEVKQTALWMHESVSHVKSHDDTGSVGIRSTTSTTFLGGDVVRLAPSFGGMLHAGVMGAYGMSDVKATGSISNSKADVDGWSAGLFLGWNAAEYEGGLLADPTGPYASGWVQYSGFSSEVTNNRSKVDVDGRGWSASVELGWVLPALPLGNTGSQSASVRLEPRFQATWFGAAYDDAVTEDRDRVSFGGENRVETELGLRAAFEVPAISGVLPYAEVNWIHSTKDASTRINGTLESREAGADNLVEAAIGSTLSFTKSLSGYGEFRVRKGDAGYTAREGNIGVRWKF